MSNLNNTPRSVRTHIGFFGKRNSGKSSLINAITQQNTAIVSAQKGTTTDPVYKSIEILPIGPCELIDTAGLDDEGDLGELRIAKTIEILNKTDIAIYVVDASIGLDKVDEEIIDRIKDKNIPIIICYNKSDTSTTQSNTIISELLPSIFKPETTSPTIQSETTSSAVKPETRPSIIESDSISSAIKSVSVSSLTGKGITELKQAIISVVAKDIDQFRIVGDLINPGDLVVLVTPIDKAAPKGRLILPQQQVIRDILESDAIGIITKEHELRHTLDSLVIKPRLVVTDSQVFLKVSADTPKDVWLTSFSILFARDKGDLNEMVKGAAQIDKLRDGDKILIAEGCTHHQQSDDIGHVKIPRWLREKTGKELDFDYASGISYGDDITKYALIVHCGACMLNQKEMQSRINLAKENKIPIVNFGVLIAYVQGILGRVLEPFPLAKMIWDEHQEVNAN